jgi:hypothetical protein
VPTPHRLRSHILQARWRRITALAGLWCLSAAGLGAQEIRGTLQEEPPGRPLPDAVVQLLAGQDSVAASVVTSLSGRFALQPRQAGRYRIRVLRIGHSPWLSSPLDLTADQVRDTTIQVSPQPVTLADIVITATTQCQASLSGDDRMALLFDQARTAMALAEGDSSGDLEFRGSTVRRIYNSTGYIWQELRWPLFTRGDWPVESQSPDSLVRFGFVQPRDSVQGPVYFGPDVPVFFSNAFLDSHCFRLVRAPKGGEELSGLAFEPVRQRELPDIEGVLWLDRTTGSLTRLVFRYTRLWDWVPKRSVGGEIQFGRLAGGRPVVTGWLLRAPIPEIGSAGRRARDDGSERFFGTTSLLLHGFEERQSRVDWIGRKGEDPLWSRAAGDTLSAVAVPFSRSPW